MSRLRAVLATGNPHKVAEIEAILGRRRSRSSAVRHAAWSRPAPRSRRTRGSRPGRAGAATGELALADDSGIEIDALGGAPGIHSARWTEEHDWIPRVLRELDGVPPAGADGAVRQRRRRGVARRARGGAAGRGRGPHRRRPPGASGGFGYDPIFVPVEGDGRTFGEMTADEKHALSHRGRAFRALRRRARGSPAPEVDGPRLEDVVAAHEVGALVERHRRVDVGGHDADAVARPASAARVGRART